jgi:predicted small lipoprotein YifL
VRAFAVILVVLTLAAGCGQKGPLYLRDKPPPGVKTQQSETYRPAPYPAGAEDDADKKK